MNTLGKSLNVQDGDVLARWSDRCAQVIESAIAGFCVVDVRQHAAGIDAGGGGAGHESGEALAPAVVGGAGRAELAHRLVEFERVHRLLAVDRDREVGREDLAAGAWMKPMKISDVMLFMRVGQRRAVDAAALHFLCSRAQLVPGRRDAFSMPAFSIRSLRTTEHVGGGVADAGAGELAVARSRRCRWRRRNISRRRSPG